MNTSNQIPDDIIFPKPVPVKLTSAEFIRAIRAFSVPSSLTAMWHLGQNSWVLKTEEGRVIAIDPYLTDFCAGGRTGVRNDKSRILPVFIEPEDFDVDIMILTHGHADHTDPWTIERYPRKANTLFLAPWQSTLVLKDAGVPANRIELMHPLQTWKEEGLEITGCFAEPTSNEELNHMGFAFRFSGGRVYYNSGDTAKSELLSHVRDFGVHWMSICINGGYHNLSHWEAAEITALIQPKIAIPAHYDMMPHNVQSPHMFKKSLSLLAPQVEYRKLDYYEAALF
ncbi:MAG: MBL fold metallo-hydrolase [Treponema sp.]|jgi:L-ascorbate 6-phosphate lactonase|nr:MBL fold metallo-hydrolase [Treponema sp.]